MSDMIHHYTDINTLALILKNKTIRFNRLNRVDDITEGDSFTKLRLEKFFFVSCWTQDTNETLPQWNMYTPDMAGVRITLPKRLFNYNPLVVPNNYKHEKQGSIISPIPFERIFASSYLVVPMFLDEKHFGREVVYDPDFMKIKNEAIHVDVDASNQALNARISDPIEIAAVKSPDWSFQKEYRFVLFIVPSPHISKDENFFIKLSERLPDIVAQSLYRGEGPDIDYFDVDISQDAINDIKVTTGPLCTEGDYLIIEAFLEKYAPSGKVEKSKFTGTIRKPNGRRWL